MGDSPGGFGLLLAELGAYASARLGARLADLGLTAVQWRALRVVGQRPGLSQQALADHLGVGPSRVVKVVGELEIAGLVERRTTRGDRRRQALRLTVSAGERIGAVENAIRDFEAELSRGLTPQESDMVLGGLRKVAAAQGLRANDEPAAP